MSAFEFVLVLYSIVVGFGIAEILSGWAQQVRARHRLTPYPLQLALSAMLLLFSLSYLWGLWTFRGVAWTFPLYLLMSAPALAVALAAHIVRVDTSPGSRPARDQYFSSSGPVFSLLALMPIFITIMSLVPALREQVPNPLNFVLITLVRVGLFFSFVFLAWSKSERLHWLGLGLLFFVIASLSARLTVRLIQGAA